MALKPSIIADLNCHNYMKISNETKVGLLTLAAIAILVLGYNFLKGKNLFSSSSTYYVKFDRVDGLLPSNDVLLRGAKIGIVDDIYLAETLSEHLLVTLSLEAGKKIPTNAEIRVASIDFLGTVAVQVVLPPLKTAEDYRNITYVEPGDTLMGVYVPPITEAITEQMQPIIEKSETMVKTLDSTLLSFNEILRSEEVRASVSNVASSIANIQGALQNVEELVVNLNDFTSKDLKTLGRIFDNLDDITEKLGGSTSDINGILKNVNELTENFARTDVAATVESLESTLNEVNELMDQIANGDGTISKVLKDDGLYNNLEQASKDLDRLLVDFREDPKRYIGLSLINIDRGEQIKRREARKKERLEKKEKK